MQYMLLWGKVLAAIQQVFLQLTLYLFTKCKACFCRKLFSVIQTFFYICTLNVKHVFMGKVLGLQIRKIVLQPTFYLYK